MPPVYLNSCLVGLALVGEHDIDAVIEEGNLPHALGEDFVTEIDGLEKVRVRPEVDLRPGLRRIADYFKLRYLLSPLVALGMDLSVPPHLNLKVFGKGVDDGEAHAVQPAENL